VDPILTDDATALVENPTLTTAYTYGQSDPIGYVDRDGRVPNKANADAVSVLRTIASLKPDGDPITQAQSSKLLGFFAKNTDTFRGRATLSLLKGYNTAQERKAKYFSRLDSRPVLEFEIEDGKLKAVKLGFGVGKRLKFDVPDKGAGATPQSAGSVASNQTGGSAAASGGDANGPGGSGKSTTATTTTAVDSGSASGSGQPPSQGGTKPATSAGAQPKGSEGQ
jgi:hypothetical protein